MGAPDEPLHSRCWEEESIGQTQALKVHISNLRKKLDSISGHSAKILTVRGFGYQLLFDKNLANKIIEGCITVNIHCDATLSLNGIVE
ncbi:winged helix-turn-helix domain-containing protein [Lysinibacillus fusiformis]|nr:winged helix-turn-helix domain-containing protein [Lysinibacillus fusiformis]